MIKFPKELPANQTIRVINLTQHPFSAEQRAEFTAAGITDVIDTTLAVKEIITFSGDISLEVIKAHSKDLKDHLRSFKKEHALMYAMVGGAPFFQHAVNKACADLGIVPMAAYSERQSVESVQIDGSVVKQNVFKHKGFISCCID